MTITTEQLAEWKRRAESLRARCSIRGVLSVHAYVLPEALDQAATIVALVAEVERLRADLARVRQERYDALSVTSRDGLLSSEWILRTGKAERERNEALAEVGTLRARVAELEGLLAETNGCHVPGVHREDCDSTCRGACCGGGA
jgi:hypothetical protein